MKWQDHPAHGVLELNLASNPHKVSKQPILVKPEYNLFHKQAMKSRRMSGGLAPPILEESGEPRALVALFLGRVLQINI